MWGFMGIAFPRLAPKKEASSLPSCCIGVSCWSQGRVLRHHSYSAPHAQRTASATGGRKASEACHIQWSGISLTPKQCFNTVFKTGFYSWVETKMVTRLYSMQCCMPRFWWKPLDCPDSRRCTNLPNSPKSHLMLARPYLIDSPCRFIPNHECLRVI